MMARINKMVSACLAAVRRVSASGLTSVMCSISKKIQIQTKSLVLFLYPLPRQSGGHPLTLKASALPLEEGEGGK